MGENSRIFHIGKLGLNEVFCILHHGHFLTDKLERLDDKRTLGGAMAQMGSDDDGQNTALMKTTESPSDASISIVCVLPRYSTESPIERLSKQVVSNNP